jgi:hypothetical protein
MALLFFILMTPGAHAESELEDWSVSDESVETTINHSAWGEFLGRYVQADESGINFVAYADVGSKDRSALKAYIKRLTNEDPRQLRKAEQLAYWVNLYNALTVEVVLRHPNEDSIQDMGDGFFSSGPWSDKLIEIGRESLSLDDIEHRILRPIWRDHRIHYAVNCASISCPNLAPVPYTAKNVEEMFSAAEQHYINHPRGVSFDDRGRLTLSKIYTWYSSDFANDEAELLHYLSTHHATAADRLHEYTGSVRYDYDWKLNAAID